MAKVFRTESLNLNGNLRLESSEAGAFEIKNAGGDVLMSKATISSDISSLTAVDVTHDSDISSLTAVDVTHDSDISSLTAKDETLDSDISSLTAVDLTHDSDISSLTAVDVTHDSDVSSLAANISSNDVVALSLDNGSVFSTGGLGAASDSATFDLGRSFTSAPVVIAMLSSSDASDPIISCMVASVSGSGNKTVKVDFADGLPSANYSLEVFASVAG